MSPDKCEVYLYPQHRRRGYARHLVGVASRMATERLRQTYWRQRKTGLVRQMRRAGFDELDVGDAIETLRLLVRVEAGLMERRAKAEAKAPRLRRAELRTAPSSPGAATSRCGGPLWPAARPSDCRGGGAQAAPRLGPFLALAKARGSRAAQ